MYTDGIKKTPDILHIINKVRSIVKALRYKSSDFHKISSDDTITFLNKMTLLSDSDPFIDDDDDDEDVVSGEDSDEENLASSSSNLKSLKLDVVTRWYSTLSMLESLKSRTRHAINTVLEK